VQVETKPARAKTEAAAQPVKPQTNATEKPAVRENTTRNVAEKSTPVETKPASVETKPANPAPQPPTLNTPVTPRSTEPVTKPISKPEASD